MMNATHTLARGRLARHWLIVALTGAILLNVGMEIFRSVQAHKEKPVVVLDLNTGTMLLSSLTDPAHSSQITNQMVLWAAQCIENRNPAGLDNPELLEVLFDTPTAKKVKDEFEAKKAEYAQKSLRSHAEISGLDPQPVAPGFIKARVSGQVLRNGVLNGRPTQEVEPLDLEITFARNPDLGTNRSYPLMVVGYQDLAQKVASNP
jgi:hypothetical protein